MTPERWAFINEYAREVFGNQDQLLAELEIEAKEAGLPHMAISSDVGRLLKLLATTTRGRLALEVGTLGGYSGIWITRGLAPDGRLITIEMEDKHADFAQDQFERAGLADRIEIRRGAALDVLQTLAGELEPGSVDVVFIDAAKEEYPDYFRLIRPLVAVGGVLMADNIYGTSLGWIDNPDAPGIAETNTFNRTVADDQEFEAVGVPIRSGVLIARRHS